MRGERWSVIPSAAYSDGQKYECYATNEKWWKPDDEDRNYGRIYGDFASEVFHDEKPAVLDHGIYEALR
jgi:hypothetical protein